MKEVLACLYVPTIFSCPGCRKLRNSAKMRYHIVYALTAAASLSAAADIYVSPSGSDTAAGTIDAPLLSIQSAVDKATAGSTIYLREGTYSPTTNIQITKSGTASAPYVLRAYDGEKVTIDGEELPGYVSLNLCGFSLLTRSIELRRSSMLRSLMRTVESYISKMPSTGSSMILN